MSLLRVLIVIHYFPPHIGGMEEVARNQAASLAADGHQVTVITAKHDRRLPTIERMSGGYTVRRLRALNVVESRFGITFPMVSPFALRTLYAAARRADVVHVHDVFYPTSHAAGIAARLARRPLFVTQHVAVVDFPNRAVELVQRAVYATAGRALFGQAQAVVTYNARVHEFVGARVDDAAKVQLQHNGIDIEFFRPPSEHEKAVAKAQLGLPEDRPIVLFVGRLVPKKGYDLVHAARGAGHHTLIVGSGYVGVDLEADEHVSFFGSADRDQLRSLYHAADVFVFPALGEPFTLVMQEAMASGLPVITTDDPAYAGAGLDRSRIRLIPRSAESVRQAIDHVLADPGTRKDMASYARQVAVERFSWRANYVHEQRIYERRRTGASQPPREAEARRG